MNEADGNLELLCECANIPEAYGVRAALEESGIRCLVQGEHTVMILGGGAMEANIRVLVAKENLAKAQELLEAFNSGENALAEGELPEEEEPGVG